MQLKGILPYLVSMTFSLRTILILTSIIAVAIALGFRLKNYVEDSIANNYRLVSAGNLFLDFKNETGDWPRDWEGLEEFALKTNARLFACENFDDLRENISIDFDIDLSNLDTSSDWSDDKPPLKLIVAKTGQMHGATFNPSKLIYLQIQRDSDEMRTKR